MFVLILFLLFSVKVKVFFLTAKSLLIRRKKLKVFHRMRWKYLRVFREYKRENVSVLCYTQIVTKYAKGIKMSSKYIRKILSASGEYAKRFLRYSPDTPRHIKLSLFRQI